MAKHKPSLMERLRAKKQQPKAPPNLVIIWYDNEEEWAKVKAASTDPERFEDSYAEWMAVVEDSLLKFAQVGVFPKKLPVQSKELAEWCRLHDKPCDSSARAEFVTELANTRAKTNAG